MASTEMRELNILLLGKSGIGKSTFINAIVNYLNIESPSTDDNLQIPVPCTFTHTKDDGSETIFSFQENNNDENEFLSLTESGTRGCKAYRFHLQSNNILLHLIDTPGIQDTNGVNQDQLNCAEIFNFLSIFSSLHAICVLLKPNEVRLDESFRSCLVQLLSQLHKSAAQNLLFVFTNARSTHFKLGRSGHLLRQLAECNQIPPDIPFDSARHFFVDNEAFHYSLISRTTELKDEEKTAFSNSWIKSRTNCLRLIKVASSLPEHNVRDSISVYRARRLISALIQPLNDILKNIERNKEICQNHVNSIEKNKEDICKLSRELYIPRKQLKLEYSPYPKVFCGSQNCIRILNIDGENVAHYHQLCLKLERSHLLSLGGLMNPYTRNVLRSVGSRVQTSLATLMMAVGGGVGSIGGGMIMGMVGAVGLLATYTCVTFQGLSCPTCNCPFRDHVIRRCESKEFDERIEIDQGYQLKISSREDAVQRSKYVVGIFQRELGVLESEAKAVMESRRKFRMFLRMRAMTLENGDWDEEEAMMDGVAENNNEEDVISPENIKQIIQDLCGLERYGGLLNEAIEEYTKVESERGRGRIINCEVRGDVDLDGDCDRLTRDFENIQI